MTPLRTAILGCGGFAARHAENMAALPEKLTLVAFCDHHPQKAAAYAQKYGAPGAAVYTDDNELFEREKLDLLAICVPPYGHRNEVAQAAQRGIHILIEKPIALDPAQAWQMVEDVEKAGIKTQVGFMLRFGAAVEALKRLIDGGETGPVGLMSARYFCNSLHAPWWRVQEKSGGQLVEQVIHMVDLMRYLMGTPLNVYSLQTNLFHREIPDYTVEDVSGTVIGFQNGGIGVIYATNGAIPGKWVNDYRLVAKSVTAEFSDANHAAFTFTGRPFLQVNSIAADQNVYMLELLDLLQAIDTGDTTRVPMREGALSLELALAARESAESGRPVVLR